jgi:TPR repeat protein
MLYKGIGCIKDMEEAFKYFKLSAKQGIKEGQYIIGFMYYNGIGCYQNLIGAYKYIKLSADNGYEKAQLNLEKINKHIIDSCKNLEDFKKCEIAANQDDRIAQQFLAIMLYYGIGCSQNKEEAYKYFKLVSDGCCEHTNFKYVCENCGIEETESITGILNIKYLKS